MDFSFKRAALLICLAFMPMTSGRAEAPPDATALMERNNDAGRVADSRAHTTFRLISSGGKERVQEAETITRRDAASGGVSRLARFLTPSDVKGTAVLTVENADRDDDIWLFLPALSKVRRLQGGNKREAYLGTDLSYGDVIGHHPSEWAHRIAGEEIVGGVLCQIVESTPVSPAVASASGYSKRVNWIRADNAVMIRAELYDSSGALFKRITQHDIAEVATAPSRWQAMRIDVENLRTRHRTEISFTGYEANIGLDADLFSPRALERSR